MHMHTTLKCMRSDHLKLSPPPRILPSISLSSHAIDHVTIGALPHKWPRALKISAAVAEEEAAAATATEEPGLVEEEEEVTEVEGDGEAEVQTETENLTKTQSTVTPINTKLYFGNLPYNVDSAQLAAIIQDYGSPELVELLVKIMNMLSSAGPYQRMKVLYNRETGRSRGFAFVTMSTIEDCNAVIENLDGREYLGRILRVNFSDKPRPKAPLYAETDYKLFVGNLSWSVTTESLIQAFQGYGNVVGARVLYDGETGRSRGYGFVCYATKEEMDTALESLDGVIHLQERHSFIACSFGPQELEGRAMRVSLAEGRRS
ncbi:hypothetical protein Patl1_25704 [Pistacia atlantica]|uniref:Uncharacterized protein n=1 Tax=Pistacia atlantica TaxID=434234 RepID=A0ACC1B1M7_9ROSI|nr:hypothetical protein Patl1_25704 [Pistacia atlantica]